MTDWEALLKETIDKVRKLESVKGGEYAKDGDRLANFRDNAKSLGTNMELVWGVYAGKHWDAIRTYISDVVKGKERERSEPIESRVDDLITYLLLFKAILREEGECGAPTPPPVQPAAHPRTMRGKRQPHHGCFCAICQRHYSVDYETHFASFHNTLSQIYDFCMFCGESNITNEHFNLCPKAFGKPL